MEENEYLLLQNLLTKYRIYCLKNYGNINMETKKRNSYLLQVRHIDYLRDRIDIILEGEEHERDERR